MTRYLLKTDREIQEFRMRHARLLRDYSSQYAAWIHSLPFMEWTPLRLPKGQEAAVIGLICCLYDEGTVNIAFSRSCTSIQRVPANEEEYQQWLDTFTRP